MRFFAFAADAFAHGLILRGIINILGGILSFLTFGLIKPDSGASIVSVIVWFLGLFIAVSILVTFWWIGYFDVVIPLIGKIFSNIWTVITLIPEIIAEKNELHH